MFSGCVTGVWCDINYPGSRPGSSSTSPAQPPPAPPRVVASTMLPNNWIRTNFVTLNLCSPGFVRKMLLITTGSSAFHTFYSDFSTVGRRDDNFQLHQHSIWQRTSDDRRHKGNCAPTVQHCHRQVRTTAENVVSIKCWREPFCCLIVNAKVEVVKRFKICKSIQGDNVSRVFVLICLASADI